MAVTRGTESRREQRPNPKPQRQPDQAKTEAEKIIPVYEPRIRALLDVPPRDSTPAVEIWPESKIAEFYAGLGRDLGDTIILGFAGFEADGQNKIILNENRIGEMSEEDFRGLVVHELAHTMLSHLQTGDGRNTTAFVEGLADYTKSALVENVSNPDNPVRKGYSGAAAFFQYIEGQEPGAVKTMVAALARGEDAPLIAATGRDFDEWLMEFKANTGPRSLEQLREKGLVSAVHGWRNVLMPGTTNRDLMNPDPQPPRLSPHFAEGGGPDIRLDGTVAGDKDQFGLIGIIGMETAPPPPPREEPPGGDNGDGGGGGGGSSSSGSSSGGSSGPRTDVYIGDQFKQDAVKRTKMQMFSQIYMQLWGEPATENYLIQAVNSGMNTWEFARAERNKPAWADTGAYKKKASDFATLLANLGIG